MILVEVNKLTYIIINHYKFLLQKIFLLFKGEANKYCCCQFDEQKCHKCLLAGGNSQECQQINKVFYRNRCVTYHFRMVLYNIRKQYQQLVNEENMNNHHSNGKLSTLIVKFFYMKHYLKKIDGDKAKALK